MPYDLERLKRYFVFGKHPDGLVDVSDGDRDVVTHVTRSEAERLIADRDEVLDLLLHMLEEVATSCQNSAVADS